MNNWKQHLTSLMPFLGILSLIALLALGSGCSSPVHPSITPKDVTGLHLASDSAWQIFERSVPDSTLGIHCDGTKYMRATCDTKLDSVGYVKQGLPADPDSLAKALNEKLFGANGNNIPLSSRLFTWPHTNLSEMDWLDLLKWLLTLAAICFIVWLVRRLNHILRHQHETVRDLNLLRGFAHERFPANQPPAVRIPTPDTSVTSVTTSHAPETLNVTDGKMTFKGSADRFHYPIIVTSTLTDADGKKQVHELRIGSGSYQNVPTATPPDAPPAPAPTAPRGAE